MLILWSYEINLYYARCGGGFIMYGGVMCGYMLDDGGRASLYRNKEI